MQSPVTESLDTLNQPVASPLVYNKVLLQGSSKLVWLALSSGNRFYRLAWQPLLLLQEAHEPADYLRRINLWLTQYQHRLQNDSRLAIEICLETRHRLEKAARH